MSAPENSPFRRLARVDDEPLFQEPWQAEILALAYSLADKGLFSPTEWSAALGAELRHASARYEPDTQDTYYRAALRALERLIARDGRITPEALAARTEQWRRAYQQTPHGQPVELIAGFD